MTSKTAKVRSLFVRAIQSADLAFEVPGIIAKQNDDEGIRTLLGRRVKACSLEESIYPLLSQTLSSIDDCRTIANDNQRSQCYREHSVFKYDAETIFDKLRESYLFVLLNGSLSTTLSQSILSRANSYLERFYASEEISTLYEQLYSDSNKDGKIGRLQELQMAIKDKHDQLKESYSESKVITSSNAHTKSDKDGNNNSKDIVTTEVRTLPIATQTPSYKVVVTENEHTTESVVNRTGLLSSNNLDFEPFNADTKRDTPPTILTEKTTTANDVQQTTTTDLIDHRHPSKDELIEYQQAQLSVQDEQLKHLVFMYKAKHMDSIMANELKLIDLDINRLQHQFLQTILVSPIDGIVSAVFKNPGDYVRIGEPVVRIENNNELLIVGFVQFRGLIRIGQKVQLTTYMFEDLASRELVIDGQVVAIRGHSSDDDEWDLIIHCKNDEDLIPLNYQFDKDNTDIKFF